MSEYGKLNGQPIEAGDGWELIGWTESMTMEGNQYTEDGVLWNSFLTTWGGWTPKIIVAKTPSIIALRRPIAAKEMVQGQSAHYLSPMIAIGRERQGIRNAGESVPASLPLNQRLFDLVRYCRAELHQQDLITDEEYTLLLAGPDGKCSVSNLESYDDIRAKLTTLRAALDALVCECEKPSDDGGSYDDALAYAKSIITAKEAV
jgi:hypothetical protein